jgi:hypothetical protein
MRDPCGWAEAVERREQRGGRREEGGEEEGRGGEERITDALVRGVITVLLQHDGQRAFRFLSAASPLGAVENGLAEGGGIGMGEAASRRPARHRTARPPAPTAQSE